MKVLFLTYKHYLKMKTIVKEKKGLKYLWLFVIMDKDILTENKI